MKKTRKNSSIKVWPPHYINYPETRRTEDQNAVIVQIEPGKVSGDYIVEVVHKC